MTQMTSYSDLHEIQALLHAFGDFAECIVSSVTWGRYGTEFTIRIDYIWEPDGTVRADDKPSQVVELTCSGVQEFAVHNRISPWILANRSELNWGFGVLSRIVAEPVEVMVGTDKMDSHKLSLRREDGTWIEIVFAELAMSERSGAPPA